MPSLNVRIFAIILNLFSIVLMKTEETFQANSFKKTSFKQESSVQKCNISTIKPFTKICGKNNSLTKFFFDNDTFH